MKALSRHGLCALAWLLLLTLVFPLPALASDDGSSAPTVGGDYGFTVDAKSAILIEAETGTVLFSQNAEEALPPASVTKIMTLLLVMEALDSGKIGLSDTVSVSEYAASMGGSQVFLEAGERMSVEELIKCTVIASANDAAVALAEHVSGSESAFVAEMNRRAAELGMTASSFENVTGLDDTVTNHACSAKDIAVMSRELISHGLILQYSSLWMDTIRDGSFTLTNTNRLVRFYDGCNGLKTGSTEKAKFCISTTATRDGMTLIAVIMGSPTRDVRNDAARKLLDYGFANYAMYRAEKGSFHGIPILGGTEEEAAASHAAFSAVVKKSELHSVVMQTELPESLSAPIRQGETLGSVIFRLGDRELARLPIVCETDSGKMNYWQVLLCLLKRMIFSR